MKITPTRSLPQQPVPDVRTFLSGWFAKFQKSRTQAVYARDLMDFAQFIGAVPVDPNEPKAAYAAGTQDAPNPHRALPPWNPAQATRAVELLLKGPSNTNVPWTYKLANAIVEEYKKSLTKRGAAGHTINRKLTVLRTISKNAFQAKVIKWYITVPNIIVEPTEPKGPSKDGVKRILAYLATMIRQKDRRSIRDYAIVRLIFDLGIRRGEIALLNVEHIALSKGLVGVARRGRQNRQWLKLPQPTLKALTWWLRIRGNNPGPLFFPMSGKGTGYMRLSETSIYRMIVELGRKCGVKARPQGIRNTAIAQQDPNKAQQFARLRKPLAVR
jgi:integrase